MADSDEKIIRNSIEKLKIKITEEEEEYRKKYLPDPTKLTNEKLICTVCNVSLAADIHKGNHIFVHRCLQVLVCETCYNFYGDGCFSSDEDGDDKYCRWCGQGGTLFLCSTCTCTFCQKCVKQNLKQSVVNELEKDDWQCYVCNPRPLFGSRTICWGAQQLNQVAKDKESERLKKRRERQEKIEEKKRQVTERKSRKASESEDETSKKKRKKVSESDSSSPEVLPSKRPRRDTRSLNGSVNKKPLRKKDASSDDESSEKEKKTSKRTRSANKSKAKKYADSSSEDESDFKGRNKSRSKKKISKESSNESSDDNKRKTRRKPAKKSIDNSDISSDEKSSKKTKSTKKKGKYSDVSSDEDTKKKKKKPKRDSSSEESLGSDKKSKHRSSSKKRYVSSEDESDNRSKKTSKKKIVQRKKGSDLDSDNDWSAGKKHSDKTKKHSNEENSSKAKTNDKSTVSNDDLVVKNRIKLAILWLRNAASDIAELGALIIRRTKKFELKKINKENLKTYEDVLKTAGKLKQLINGAQSNYEHIEKNLDAQLKPWKILTGLEEGEKNSPDASRKESSEKDVSKLEIVPGTSPCDLDSKVSDNNCSKILYNETKISADKKQKNDSPNETQDCNLNLQWSENDESDGDDKNSTGALITKASESLDKMDVEEGALFTKASENLDKMDVEEKKLEKGEQEGKENTDTDNQVEVKKLKKSEQGGQENTDTDSQVEADLNPKDENSAPLNLEDENSNKSEIDDSNKKESDLEELESTNGSVKSSYKKLQKNTSQLNKETESTGKKEGKEQKSKISNISSTDEIESDSKDKELPKKNKKEDGSRQKPKENAKSKTGKGREAIKKKRGTSVSKTHKDLEEIEDGSGSSQDSLSFEKFSRGLEEKWHRNFETRKTEEDSSNHSVSKNKTKETTPKKNLKENKLKVEKETEKLSSNKNTKSATCKSTEEKRNESKTHAGKIKIQKEIEKEQLGNIEDEKDNVKCEILSEKSGNSEDEHLEKEENEQDESCVNKTTENMECESVLKEKENGEDVKKEIQTFENGDGKTSTKTRKPDSKLKTDDVEKKYEWLDSSTEEIESRDKEIPSKTKGLSSTDEEEAMKKSQGKQKVLKKKSTLNRRTTRNLALLESSDEENEHEKEKKTTLHSESSDEDRNPKENKDDGSLSGSVVNLSSAESSDSDIFVEKKRKDKTKKKSDSEGEEESGDKKPKKKRKLIRCKTSSDESGKSGDENLKTSKKSKQGESPGKGGRKNIKKIKKGYDLEQATKEAGEEEKERRKRIEERQKLFNQVFDIKETKKLDKLVLDFDPDSKKELLSVDKDLVTKMKPHQAKGVKFMWDSCFESISQLKKKSGSGCILAHCMGLGKTFQVISLVHTLLMHEETQVRTVMVVCPLSTVLNWYNEFSKWLEDVEGGDSIDVYHLTKSKKNIDRARELRHWQDSGGVLIIGYDMFRNLTSETVKRLRAKIKKDFQETLVDPGADLIVCDEGHMLKNEATALSKAMSKVKTLRRIVLTGTPMQNNLKEYHCMVQFVKPNLLGTRKEFLNRFVNPITNGQFVDSTDSDVKVMKRRAHVLHKMLEGLVQRFDYNVLTPFLPPKHEYVISVSLSELQVKLYQHYLENYSQKSDNNKAGSRLFQDWQALGRIWTHPRVLKMSTERENYKKMMAESDEEGSLKDFIDDGNDDESSESPSNDSDNSSGGSIKSVDGKKSKGAPVRRATRSTRSSNKTNDAHLQSSGEEDNIVEQEELSDTKGAWWSELIEPKHMDDINQSGKLALLFAILKECETIEDKVLVFSQSLFSLDLIEYFLDKIDCATQENRLEEHLGNYQGNWSRGLDYFRLDGSTSSENRSIWCKAFNREDNPRARLFLISTRAGGLGINLTGANRVIIFDASWNPSHDVQSIFRIYRFGQKKPCYIYRFIAHGTMEEKVYDRQVAKQSMSNRVIDEQQVHRHFSSNDLNELYSFTPPSKTEDKETPALPKDVLMAEILGQFRDWIEKYHEHDSLLENVEEEELNEEERKLAWEDYENDKKRGFMPASTGNTFTGPGNFMSAQIEIMKRNLEAKYPEKSPEEIQTMLVIQVSDLMRKQQQQQLMLRQQQAAAQAAQMQTNAIAQGFGKLTQEQLFNLQVLQMKQQQNANAYLNLYQSNMAKLQMNQVRQQVPQNVFSQRFQQPTNLQGQSHLSNLLSVPQPFSTNVQLQQQANASTAQKIQLERMKQSYLTNNQNSSDGKTSKVPDEKKTSKS